MEFNFPDNKTIYNGTIQVYKKLNGKTSFSYIDIQEPKDNLIAINNIDYYFTYLKGADPGNKGGNSIILNLYESQTIDSEKIEYGIPNKVIKISKIKWSNPRYPDRKDKRFLKEIKALYSCNEKKFQNIVKIFEDGVCKIKDSNTDEFEEHLFFTMEYANNDLKEYIELNHDGLNISAKLSLCKSLCEGLNELYALGYYHRDIKPDNIFIIDKVWKIGDLGLLSERDKENEIDKIAEAIGPKGWMSPESMNKYLCEGKNFAYFHNCIIDHQSDIFQLGKVFWYIFQHNAPIGTVKEKDFLVKDSRIYSVIKTMLNHSKRKRYKKIEEVIKIFKKLEAELLKQQVA